MLKELQRMMIDSGMTDRALAQATGLSPAIVQGIRSGRKPNPTINTYSALHNYLRRRRRKTVKTATV